MGNIFDILFSEVNLVLTVLLMILLLYWVVSMIGGLDFDVDFDVEVDLDPAIDAGTAMDGGNMDFQDLSNAELNQEDVVEKDALRSNGGRFSSLLQLCRSSLHVHLYLLDLYMVVYDRIDHGSDFFL